MSLLESSFSSKFENLQESLFCSPEDNKVLSFCSLFVIYFLLNKTFYSLFYSQFPSYSHWEAFQKPSYMFKTLMHPYFTVVLLGGWGPWLLIYESSRWKTFRWKPLRVLIVLSAFLLGIQWATIETNLLFEQYYLLERMLLIVLPLLIYYHPFFVIPFLQLLLSYLSQYQIIVSFDTIDFYILIEILFLFSAFLIIRHFFNLPEETLIVGIISYFGAIYFSAGVSKLENIPNLGFLYNYSTHLSFMQWSFTGWKFFLPVIFKDAFVWFLRNAGWTLNVFVLIFELGIFLIYTKRFLTKLFLFSIVSFHLFVFFLSGAFFWQYIIFCTAILIAIIHYQPDWDDYSNSLIVISVIFILASPYLPFIRTNPLQWMISRYNQKFIFEAKNKEGRTYPIRYDSFRPYLRHFLPGLQRLLLFTEGPQLTIASLNPKTIKSINNELYNQGDLDRLKTSYGRHFSNSVKAEQLQILIGHIVKQHKNTNRKTTIFNKIINCFPIPHYLNNTYSPNYHRVSEIPGEINQVQIRMIESVYRNQERKILNNKIIEIINLDNTKKDFIMRKIGKKYHHDYIYDLAIN